MIVGYGSFSKQCGLYASKGAVNVRLGTTAAGLKESTVDERFAAEWTTNSEVAALLDATGHAFGMYTIRAEDAATTGGAIPADYAEKAALEYLDYETAAAEHWPQRRCSHHRTKANRRPRKAL